MANNPNTSLSIKVGGGELKISNYPAWLIVSITFLGFMYFLVKLLIPYLI